MDAFRTKRFEHEGRMFEAAGYYDEHMGPPWEEHDGHGSMREIRTRAEKKPGERLIYRSNSGGWYAYDWQGAMEAAKRDGWGLRAEDKAKLAERLGREPTQGEIRQQAVQEDFEYLDGWVNDWWHWMGVGVRIIGADGEPQGDEFEHTVWGFESEGDYWLEAARQIADEILSERKEAWRAALREARERRYWASRDVETV